MILCEVSTINEEIKSQGGSAMCLMTLEIPENLYFNVSGSCEKP